MRIGMAALILILTLLPAAAQDRLAAPARAWVEPFATTPMTLNMDKWGFAAEQPLEVMAVIERLSHDKHRHGVVMTSVWHNSVEVSHPAESWLQPGMQAISIRRQTITGVLTFSEFVIALNGSRSAGFVLNVQRGMALSDRMILLDELTTITPRICWDAVPGATGYHLERQRGRWGAWHTIYDGSDTVCPDPLLRETIEQDAVYHYRVWACRNTKRSALPTTVNSLITATPLRAIMKQTHPRLRPGTAAYSDALFDALQHYPNPAMRLAAAWELGHARDRSILPRLLPLLHAPDPELAANAALILRFFGGDCG
ncbi:MAG: hypothetical protein BWY76_00673 [bacterium ADurb.Bin429]|nr:MAG: hypothetical protein BWY76_00673 [bacterium ADurb.Bin429]